MTGSKVGLWWRVMWCFFTPVIIVFILVLHIIDGISLDSEHFPDWSYGLGITLTVISVVSIPIFVIRGLGQKEGSLLKRFRKACKSDDDWGPAIASKRWKNVDFYPAVNTQSLSTESCPQSPTTPIRAVSDHVDLTSSTAKLTSLSHTSYFSFGKTTKKPQDIRQRAILNQAYCASNGSIDKLPPHIPTTDSQHKANVIFIAKKPVNVKTRDKSTQTDDKSYTLALKRGSLKSGVLEMKVEESPPVSKSTSNKHVVQVEVARF